ncbi:MAG: cytochrome c-type biogenesis protein CcmH [Actinomycetota bacterium]|nr:cytochrome c-type biogenesis protein CcmH [Actinomycetota bacterium]
MRVVAAAATCLLLLASPAAAAAPEDVANDISNEIMSPYCDGVTLHDCPSREALELRDRIEAWVSEGQSRAQIMAHLEQEFGAGIRAVPPAEGTGFVAWLPPVVALSAGAAGAWAIVRKWSRRTRPASPVSVTMTTEERHRLDHELAMLRAAASREGERP